MDHRPLPAHFTSHCILRRTLAGSALGGAGFRNKHQANVTQNNQHTQKQEGHLPVISDSSRLQIIGHHQCQHAAQLVARPPADNSDRRPGGHAPVVIPVDLFDAQRINGDVLRRRTDGDDQASADHQRDRCCRLEGRPETQTDKNHRLKRDNPRLAVTKPVSQQRNAQPVNQRCPQKIDRINAENQASPPDGAARQPLLLQPE